MGTDYAARKAAKRRGKKAGAEAAADGGSRPKRRNGPRRLCTGPCFGVPQLTDDDVAWSDGDEAAPAPPPEAMAAAVKAAAVLAESAERVGGAGRKKREGVTKKKEDKEPKIAPPTPKPKLSTSVGALLPAEKSGPSGGGAAPDLAPDGAAVLAALPARVRHVARDVFKLASPTRVQAAVWPPAAAGKDVLALAPPGAGKTLAYLVPVVADVMSGDNMAAVMKDETPTTTSPSTSTTSPSTSTPTAVILVPTRELARQVYRDAAPVRSLVRCACVYGGTSRDDQVARLAGGGVKLLVATPGRLLDLVEAGVVGLATTTTLVLDEADKMLAMGLGEQVDKLKALTRRPPRVTLASATLPPAVERAAAAWLRGDAVRVSLAATSSTISPTITQAVHVCAEHKKPAKLKKHLAAIAAASAGARAKPRVLIFCNRVKTVKFVTGLVRDEGFRVDCLHGERSQDERERALAAFRALAVQVLVATDVGGRGLHVPSLAYVVNYDFPPSLDAYVHRVGRAGRLGADGHAFSFFTRPLAPLARPLAQLLMDTGAAVDPNLVRLGEAYDEAMRHTGRPPGRQPADDGDDDVVVDDDDDDDEPSPPPPPTSGALSAAQLPGLYRKRRRGGDESDDEAVPVSAKKKALPGRLRKKLAKDRAAKGG